MSQKQNSQNDIEMFMNQVSQLEQVSELDRVTNAFTLDPLNILGLPYHATSVEIRRQYKRLSLKVHPDKAPPDRADQARAAFDKVAIAYKDALDEDKRRSLNEIVRKKVQPYTPELDRQLKEEVGKMLVEKEWRVRQMKKIAKKFDERLAEEEVEKKNRRRQDAEHEMKWAEDRESRVDSWRRFKTKVHRRSRKRIVKGAGPVKDCFVSDKEAERFGGRRK